MVASCRILQASQDGVYVLRFVGEIRLNVCTTLEKAFRDTLASKDYRALVIDLQQASMLDSTSLGLIARVGLEAEHSAAHKPYIINASKDVMRMIDNMDCSSLFHFGFSTAREALGDAVPGQDFEDVAWVGATEEEIQHKVLEAHRTLMSLSEQNRETFRDLVEALECR